MNLDRTTINTLWSSALIEELVRNDVSHFIISPGSRSAPLVVAAARHPRVTTTVHIDERGAAFFALGYARATGKTAALICTSGTAAANFYPAVVESSMDSVPMILLTADRPPELQNKGANQTIPQPGMYASFTRHTCELLPPSTLTSLKQLLRSVDESVAAATGTPAGPVHINCMFREPLAPLPSDEYLEDWVSELDEWVDSTAPFNRIPKPVGGLEQPTLEKIHRTLQKAQRGLFVVGALHSSEQRLAVASLADKLGWPLLADIGSGLRGGELWSRIDYFDLLLGSHQFQANYRPDTVLQVGSRLTSRRLLAYLESTTSEYIQILDHPYNHDPIDRVTDRQQADIATACRQIEAGHCMPEESDWLSAWKTASTRIDGFLEASFANAVTLTEPLVARMVTSELEREEPLWLASSMPIRDVDLFADPRANWYPVAANRGVSGIDGTIASATGYAHGCKRRVTVLIGDLAMLHDLNSLALLKEPSCALTIVVINNNGGGIFGHLPISQSGDLFEKFFVAPHGVRFESAARMFGLPYSCVESPDALAHALKTRHDTAGSCMIEVIVDRLQSQQFHAQLVSEAAVRTGRL